eukprot:comp9960_c0_seq1/m.4855 comp9960_c0_seq1/g.4855  ORF comp9960_c0_seq1/g.4855 comp9960_c0_seq1/m.4855 type:complete len:335 (-) comp9960_c0_seq1:310-1314(-)
MTCGATLVYSAQPSQYCVPGAFVRLPELGEKLGQGCFSTVYLAKDAYGRNVAVKVISKQRSDRESVDAEIESLVRVRGHPNIMQLYDVLEDDKNVYLVLEYCPLGNLHEYLVKLGSPLSEDQARKWFTQLVDAVTYCHNHGVIHRDIKNANILLALDAEGDLCIKLADFGLAKVTQDAHSENLWTATGSPVFAAPEVYKIYEHTPYKGPSAEVWACGAVLHSMLALRLPFDVNHYSSQWACYLPPRNISRECRALLLSLFRFEANQRPTFDDIRSHEWVCVPVVVSESDSKDVEPMPARRRSSKIIPYAMPRIPMTQRAANIGQQARFEVMGAQ